uniref:cardiolipin synthase (CMP-forming) n=1 Tax=Denticeps clupeoides TaxID=299321 RepID=A0AAY4BM92_9TELE
FLILSPLLLFHCTNKLFLTEQISWSQLKEFTRKNAANALSLSNMVMGMTSILCSLNGHQYSSCWLVLIGYLLDLADGAVARQLNACSALGAKLDDFADFTTFGIATSLLLWSKELMDNILCMCYVLSVFIRLCFFSSGIHSSCVSLLSGGNMAVLRATAIAMILFYGEPELLILNTVSWNHRPGRSDLCRSCKPVAASPAEGDAC